MEGGENAARMEKEKKGQTKKERKDKKRKKRQTKTGVRYGRVGVREEDGVRNNNQNALDTCTK